MTIQKAVETYNALVKEKYDRGAYHYNFTVEDVLQNPRLLSKLAEFTKDPSLLLLIKEKMDAIEKILQKTTFNIHPYSLNDVCNVVDVLKRGELVVIPNERIYVIHGMEQGNSTKVQEKINKVKTRHQHQPLARLITASEITDSANTLQYEEVIRYIAGAFHPIGFLLPDKYDKNRTILLLVYNRPYFTKFFNYLQADVGKDIKLYVSSGNTTTTSAHTTLEGVKSDIGWKGIEHFVDDGNLKRYGASNSTTIIQCSKEGLTYYRVGSPSIEEIDLRMKEVFKGKYSIKRTEKTRTTVTG